LTRQIVTPDAIEANDLFLLPAYIREMKPVPALVPVYYPLLMEVHSDSISMMPRSRHEDSKQTILGSSLTLSEFFGPNAFARITDAP
jgi:hypothetical protein